MSRLRGLLDYVERLDTSKISAALTELREGAPDWDLDAKIAVQVLLTCWGKSDPDGASSYVAGLDLRRGGGDAADILDRIASADPQRAIDWLQEETHDRRRRRRVGALACPEKHAMPI